MGGFGSIWHWLIVALIVLVLFGRGKVSDLMGDFGKGVSSFKKGMAEAEDVTKPAAQIPPPPAPAPATQAEPAPAPAPERSDNP